MTAFATYTDLALRLNRTFTDPEQAWVTALLEDAAEFMRGVMNGNQVYPSSQSTYTAYPVEGRVILPQTMIRSVDAVVSPDTSLPVAFTYRQGIVFLTCDDPVDVTFTYGLDTAPQDLVNINCVLVSQQMTTIAAQLGLSGGGVSSVAIDDFKLAFADGGAGTGLSLTDSTTKYLERRYGTQAWVVKAYR
jgi:hypothetical protein